LPANVSQVQLSASIKTGKYAKRNYGRRRNPELMSGLGSKVACPLQPVATVEATEPCANLKPNPSLALARQLSPAPDMPLE
jgi:hypothetical protein